MAKDEEKNEKPKEKSVEEKLQDKREQIARIPGDHPSRCKRCGSIKALDKEHGLCARCIKQIARLKADAEKAKAGKAAGRISTR
jgi:hypothetical protein